ncbi:MAG: hypothetical protein ABI416_14235 [Ginsengibacter sp.]
MCNCGKKRSGNSQQSAAIPDQQHRRVFKASPGYSSFEYTGKTALTIIGNVTGAKYRFSHPGNTQDIDHLDTPGMMAVPVLRKVK